MSAFIWNGRIWRIFYACCEKAHIECRQCGRNHTLCLCRTLCVVYAGCTQNAVYILAAADWKGFIEYSGSRRGFRSDSSNRDDCADDQGCAHTCCAECDCDRAGL